MSKSKLPSAEHVPAPLRVLFAQRQNTKQSYPAAPGAVLPRGSQHAHPFWQMDVLYSGETRLELGQEQRACPAGTVVWIPPQTVHRFSYLKKPCAFLSVKCEVQTNPQAPLSLSALSGPVQDLINCIDALFGPDCRPAKRESRAINGLLAALFCLCYDDQQETQPRGTLIPAWLLEVHQHIQAVCGVGLRVADLAQTAHVSTTHLSQQFQKHYHVGIKTFIDEQRLARAKELLLYADASISEIAYQLAYPDVFCFSKFFKKCTGFSPRAFRQHAHC